MVQRISSRGPWYSYASGQPKTPFTLDKDHPINDSLAVFMPLGSDNRLNLASPVRGSYDGTIPSIVSTKHGGLATHFPGTTNHGINFGDTAYVDTSKPFTIAFWFVLDSLTSPETFPGAFNLTSIGAIGQSFECFFSTNASFQGISFGTQNNLWLRIKTDTADADVLGGPHLAVISYNGADAGIISNFAVEVDGVVQTLAIPSTFGLNIHDNVIGLIGTTDWQGDMWWFRIWQNRQLTAAQRFQLFDPATRFAGVMELGRILYFFAPAMGVTTRRYRLPLMGVG